MVQFFNRFFKVLSLFFALVALSSCKEEQIARMGELAPEIGAINLEGETVLLSDLKGKVTLLNFWQGGCVPCLTEMPHLQAIHEKYQGRPVYILSVNNGGGPRIIRNAIEETNVTFDFAVDELFVASTRYQVHFFPTSFIIDKNGIVRDKIIGEVREQDINQHIDDLLAQ